MIMLVVPISPKDTFSSIPISIANHLKLIAIFGKNWAKIIGIINEEFDIIELVASVKLGEKPSRRLFCCGRIEVRWRISLVY
jgi:hypothetical protein